MNRNSPRIRMSVKCTPSNFFRGKYLYIIVKAAICFLFLHIAFHISLVGRNELNSRIANMLDKCFGGVSVESSTQTLSRRNTIILPGQGAKEILERKNEAVGVFPSIIGIPELRKSEVFSEYMSRTRRCKVHPYLPNLHAAIDKIDAASQGDSYYYPTENELLIYIDILSISNRQLFHLFYDRAVADRIQTFESISILISSLVKDPFFVVNNTVHQGIFGEPNIIYPKTYDEEIIVLRRAANLLVHGGKYAALAGLIASGTVFFTYQFEEYMNLDDFKWLIESSERIPSIIWHHSHHLNDIGRVHPSCCQFEAFGAGDDKKVACMNTKHMEEEHCWVLSVGCHGAWDFEAYVTSRLSCDVHTFDCTGTWEVPDDLKGRVFFHKICLGASNAGEYRVWKEILSIANSYSTREKYSPPVIAKMDIEGYEFPVLHGILESPVDYLPSQFLVEIHSMSLRELYGPALGGDTDWKKMEESPIRQLFHNISSLGYKLVRRSDNPFCQHCSEVTIVRESSLPDI